MKLQFSRTFAILTQNREALKLRAGTALQSAARWGRSNQRRFIAFCHPAPSRQPLTLATLRWWREPSNPIHSRMFFFMEVVKRDSSVLLVEDWRYERLPLAWNYNIHTSGLPAHVLEDWRYERLPLACQLLPAIHHRGREGARPGTAIRKPTYNESIISKREI